MDFNTIGRMGNVCTSLVRAAERGIDVSVAFDRRSYMDIREAPRLKRFGSELANAGGALALLGEPLLPNPAAGRSHSKLWRIDEASYFGGGVNLSDESFDTHDFMLRSTDAALGAALDAHLVPSIGPETTQEDYRIVIDDANALLVDGGAKNHSLIFDSAVAMVHDVEKAWYVSQFLPGKALERKLLEEVPPENLTVLANTASSSQGRAKLIARIDTLFSRVNNRYTGRRRVHAKFIVVQKKDGSYEAITGSNNFSDWGIRFGTKEAALHTTDQATCEALIRFTQSLQRPPAT